MAHKKLANPYNQGGPPSFKNPNTRGVVQPGGRKYGFETKSDSPSPTGLKGDKPKKY